MFVLFISPLVFRPTYKQVTSRSVIEPKNFSTYSLVFQTQREPSSILVQWGLTWTVLPPLSFVKINKISNNVIICHVFNCFMLVKSKADKCDEWIFIACRKYSFIKEVVIIFYVQRYFYECLEYGSKIDEVIEYKWGTSLIQETDGQDILISKWHTKMLAFISKFKIHHEH